MEELLQCQRVALAEKFYISIHCFLWSVDGTDPYDFEHVDAQTAHVLFERDCGLNSQSLLATYKIF